MLDEYATMKRSTASKDFTPVAEATYSEAGKADVYFPLFAFGAYDEATTTLMTRPQHPRPSRYWSCVCLKMSQSAESKNLLILRN